MCPFRCVLNAYCNIFKDIIGWTHFPKEFLVNYLVIFFSFSKTNLECFWLKFLFFQNKNFIFLIFLIKIFDFFQNKNFNFWYFWSKFSAFFKINFPKNLYRKSKSQKWKHFLEFGQKVLEGGPAEKNRLLIHHLEHVSFHMANYWCVLETLRVPTTRCESCWPYSCCTR